MLRVSELSETEQSAQTALQDLVLCHQSFWISQQKQKNAKGFRLHWLGIAILDQKELSLPDLDIFELENSEIVLRHKSFTRSSENRLTFVITAP